MYLPLPTLPPIIPPIIPYDDDISLLMERILDSLYENLALYSEPPQPPQPILQKIILPPLLQKSFTTTPCKITLLPSELLIQICSYLTPYELFLLRETCVRFNKFLDAPKSSTTQEIWKNSRKEFLKVETNPPKGMSEREYVKLLYYKEYCQFCGYKYHRVKIYWQFKVRCCYRCFMKNTISLEEVLTEYQNMPDGLLKTIPFYMSTNKCYFWKNTLNYIYIQYLIYLKSNALFLPEFYSFLNSLKSDFEIIMNYSHDPKFMLLVPNLSYFVNEISDKIKKREYFDDNDRSRKFLENLKRNNNNHKKKSYIYNKKKREPKNQNVKKSKC